MIRFDQVVKLDSIQLLIHQNKIPKKIEIFSWSHDNMVAKDMQVTPE